jgi:RNA 2',3'-cyclic 3'-phosphodiesterase
VAIDAADAAPSGRGEAPTHLTLRFLGDVDASSVGAIERALRPVGPKFRPFFLTFEGVGAFPSRASVRVVWRGVGEGREELTRLAEEVAVALERAGVPRERTPFVPHLTLFRVRSARDRSRAGRLLEGDEPAPAPRRMRVDEFLLKESTLTPSGPVHRTVARFPLGGPPGDGR